MVLGDWGPALSSGAQIAGAPFAAWQRQGGDLGPGAPIAGARIAALPEAASGPSRFSNDSIDLLFEQMQSCKGYICSFFLQNDFSNVFKN